jgi:hypothetical protein
MMHEAWIIRRALPLLLLTPFGSRAAVPVLEHLFPVAQQVGTTGIVAVVGKYEPWSALSLSNGPPKVWVDAPGLVFESTTNSGRFSVRVAADAAPRAFLVRLYNDEGCSGARYFITTRQPQVAEVEPNDDFTKPQPITVLPASINGRLEKSGDVDSFGVRLEAGQTLLASVEAYVLATPLDAVLRVVDARGTQVAWNHDDGRTLDPFVAFTAKAAGEYVVQVFGFSYPADSEVRFTGNAKCVYRLHLFGGAYARYTVPLGVQRGAHEPLEVVGWNLARAGRSPDKFVFDATALTEGSSWTEWATESFQNRVRLPIGDGPELVEQEPNDTLTNAVTIPCPVAVSGRIDRPGDIDRYRFSVKKGEEFLLAVQSAALGLGVDTWLRVDNDEGKELKRAEDSGGMDPALEWTAARDGDLYAVVGSLLHRGGPESWYRLSVRRAAPTIVPTVAAESFTVEAGKTNEVKLKVKLQHGAKGKFLAVAHDLPAGVRAAPVDVPEKGGDVTLLFEGAPDAKAFSGPFRLAVRNDADGRERNAVFEFVTSGENNGVPNGFQRLVREETDQLWLTVKQAKPAKSTNLVSTAGAPAAK